MKGVHTVHMDAKSWTIFAFMMGFLIPVLFYLVFEVLSIAIGYKIAVWFITILIILMLVRSYWFIRFLRWLGEKAMGKHTFE